MSVNLLLLQSSVNDPRGTIYTVDIIGHDGAWKCALDLMEMELRATLKKDVVDRMMCISHRVNPFSQTGTRYTAEFLIR